MTNYKLSKKSILFLLIGFLIILSSTLIILPSNFFDSGQSICLSVLLLNRECYGCGMTRAIQHLIHFEFEMAYNYNKLSFVVFPLFVYLILKELLKLYKQACKENKL